MAQVCADIRSTGRQFVNARTGQLIQCNSGLIAAAPASPAGPATPAAPSATPRTIATANCPAALLTVDGQQVRCGPQTQSIRTRTTTFAADAQVARSRISTATSSLVDFFQPAPVPASNPRGVSTRQVLPVPKGYTRVWNDGRHNPNRGLPKTKAVAPAAEARISTRTAPVAAPSHRYVQVGTFANAANAQSLGQRFMGMGLPVGMANAAGSKVVLLGPFNSTNALNRGLSAARNAGYSSAFTRN